MLATILWLALGIALGAPAPAHDLSPGRWGGDTLILEVLADGANVEFECAIGRIDKPIRLDRRGNFDLPGTVRAEGHGPVRDGADSAAKARYRGHVAGGTMTLTVIAGDQQMGPYTLTRDRRPILKKCR
jgi:hypothetical protein